MRPTRLILVASLLVFLLVGVGCSMEKDLTRMRVTRMLEHWQLGGLSDDGNSQVAISQWYVGGDAIGDLGQLSLASDKFGAWAREKDLGHKITSWEVTSVTTERGSGAFIAAVVIEGKGYKIRVLRGEPMTWVD